jgi:hypothetical protein
VIGKAKETPLCRRLARIRMAERAYNRYSTPMTRGIYPNDADGDVLRRMEAHGDDLTRPRNIDFTVVFADASAAEQFAEHFRALGKPVSVKRSECDPEFPWDVVVIENMVPSYDGITDFEDLLQSAADRWGGHNDGWGCFSEPKPVN